MCLLLLCGRLVYGKNHLHSDCNGFYASVECLHHQNQRETSGGRRRYPSNGMMSFGRESKTPNGFMFLEKQFGGQNRNRADRSAAGFSVVSAVSRLARDIYLDYSSRVEPFETERGMAGYPGKKIKKDKGKDSPGDPEKSGKNWELP